MAVLILLQKDPKQLQTHMVNYTTAAQGGFMRWKVKYQPILPPDRWFDANKNKFNFKTDQNKAIAIEIAKKCSIPVF